MESQSSSDPLVQAFADAHRRGQDAFNDGDFERAFAGLAPDVQWHMADSLIETGLYSGRDAVISYFRAVRDAGDWHVRASRFEAAGPGRFLVHQVGTATGRTSGIRGQREFFQVWTLGSDGLVHEVREFETREQALAFAETEDT
jgi:SnoaL-like domain